MSSETGLGNTTCSRGHTHPPWKTTGVLRITKCESVCGFCQKETKTAANLRKHVAIHIKNERLNLSIAEGLSGRGRLEMPMMRAGNSVSSSSRVSVVEDDDAIDLASHAYPSMNQGQPPPPLLSHAYSDFSTPAALLAMREAQPSYSASSSRAGTSSPTPCALSPHLPRTYSAPSTQPTYSSSVASYVRAPTDHSGYPWSAKTLPSDPYKHLRDLNIGIRHAWTNVPASEGFRILALCKSMSTAAEGKVPCYNRETLFDEEWQAHMKDVHGVFLIWPGTWMRRIEVLDLEPFGGDILAVNDVVMDS